MPNTITTKRFKNLVELFHTFSTEQACLDHLKELRWKDGEYCPYCNNTKIYTYKDGKMYKCAACRKRFSLKVGTIFEESPLPLQKWFGAIYLITSHKKGISSVQMAKDLGVTQKTAWFMVHRLRYATNTKAFNRRLEDTVEVDETYIGGKEKNKHFSKRTKGTQGRSTQTKHIVLGMMERGGNLKAKVIDGVGSREIKNAIVENVIFGSKLVTDEFRSYRGLEYVYDHLFVKHRLGEYVNGLAHTNTIESFWSILKRGIVGIYHFVSKKHLSRYLAEFTFRYNTRAFSEEERFNYLLSNCQGRLAYATLIGNEA